MSAAPPTILAAPHIMLAKPQAVLAALHHVRQATQCVELQGGLEVPLG